MIKYVYRVSILLIVLSQVACSLSPEVDESARKASSVNTELGIIYMKQGKNALAMSNLTKAIKQNPKNAETHNAIALLYARLGEIKDAQQHFEKAVSFGPENSSIHVSYGAFLCERKQLDKAEKQFLEALENPLYTKREIAYSNAGNCALRGGNMSKAENYFRDALKVRPKFSPALFQMAKIKVMKKNYMSGRAYLQRYNEVARPSSQSLWLSIQVEKELGDKNAASSMAMLLRNQYPDSDEVKKLQEMEKNEQSSRK